MEPKITWTATNLAAAILLPPFNLVLLQAAGLLLLKRRPRLGKNLIAVGLALLYLLSTPLVADSLIHLLQSEPLLPNQKVPVAGAIVVLGAGRYANAAEYGGDTASALALERLRYAAYLQRKTGLPVLTTGGSPTGGIPEGRFMREILEQEFHVPVRWTEEASDNTWENALYTRRILAPLGIKKILLVSHAWHMARAVPAFEDVGFTVVPAGTRFSVGRPRSVFDFVPDASGLRMSAYAMHEYIGVMWYRVRALFR
jgi:uncharacterized SAM-binding protein YcdF (DUF218 family)